MHDSDLGNAADAPMAPIVLSPEVCIDFHAGAGGAWWATMHVGDSAHEIGSIRTEAEVDVLLTLAAGVLLERSVYADDVWISPDRQQRWVLIGCWLLNARMVHTPARHLHMGTPEQAREVFDRRRGTKR